MFYRRPESGTLKCGFARARVGFGDGGVWVLSGCGRAETVGLRGSAVVVLRRAVGRPCVGHGPPIYLFPHEHDSMSL